MVANVSLPKVDAGWSHCEAVLAVWMLQGDYRNVDFQRVPALTCTRFFSTQLSGIAPRLDVVVAMIALITDMLLFFGRLRTCHSRFSLCKSQLIILRPVANLSWSHMQR